MSENANVYSPDLAQAPMPDKRTLRLRNNLPYQIWRFAIINLKMMRVIFHKG